MVETKFTPKPKSRFDFKKKEAGTISIRLDADTYARIMAIAKERETLATRVAQNFVEIGLEEYEKEIGASRP